MRSLNRNFYAQRGDADGNILWPTSGAPICTEPHMQDKIMCILDGSNGLICTWEDYRTEIDLDIYSSMIDMDGQPVATLLQSYDLQCEDGAIFVRWTLSDSVDPGDFTVSRRETANGLPWSTIPIDIEGRDGSYSFTDETCLPGSIYSYRVELTEDGAQRVLF
jgi:hypothetical protein